MNGYVLIGSTLLLATSAVSVPVLADDDERGDRRYRERVAVHQVERYAPRRDARFDARVEQRLDRQRYRIRQGVQSGELTRGERKRLRRQQREVTWMYRHFGADDRYSRRERELLRGALDRNSDRIYRTKHNDRYRYRERVRAPARTHHHSYVDLWLDGVRLRFVD